MLSQIIEAEQQLDALLPARRLEQRPPADLLLAASAWSKVVWSAAKRLGPMPLTDEQISQGLQLAQKPVFICGVHRSGTTLVRNLLDGHPQLSVLPSEGTFYTNQESKLQNLPQNEWATYLGTEWLRRLANPINQPPYWLLGRSNNAGSPYINFARYVMAWWQIIAHQPGTQWPHTAIVLAYASCTGNLGAKLWVDKTPANERFLARIWQEMPQAKIIHVIREPIATIASRKTMEPTIGLSAALRDLEISYTVAIQQTALKDPRFLLIRYEELCDDPEEITAQMAAFLAIENLEILKQATVSGVSAKANSSFNKNPASGQILKADEHRPQDAISATNQWQIAAYIGRLSHQLNYPLAKIGIVRSILQRIKYKLF
ncbi:MAG: sulfotransferase [Bacteroidota bacterium]